MWYRMNSAAVTLKFNSLILIEFKAVGGMQDMWTAQRGVNFNTRSLNHMGSYHIRLFVGHTIIGLENCIEAKAVGGVEGS
jgi:hypothetical protein